MTRNPILLAGAIAVALMSHPAAAQNTVSAEGSRVRVEVPADGALGAWLRDAADDILTAARDGDLHGCIDLDIELVESDDGHSLQTVPQRPGQFVRTVVGAGDPYVGPRALMIGEADLVTEQSVREALTGLLAPEEGPRGWEPKDAAARTTDRIVMAKAMLGAAEHIEDGPACRFRGSGEITVRHRPFNMRVSAEVAFTLTVHADGTVDANVPNATRRVTSQDREFGACSNNAVPMSRLRLDGRSDGDRLSLTFRPRGDEPDFTMNCSGGTVSIGGSYISDYLYWVDEVTLDAADGASITRKSDPRFSSGPGTGTFRIRLLR